MSVAIHQSVLRNLPYDLPTRISEHLAEKAAHKYTVGIPAPIADPIVSHVIASGGEFEVINDIVASSASWLDYTQQAIVFVIDGANVCKNINDPLVDEIFAASNMTLADVTINFSNASWGDAAQTQLSVTINNNKIVIVDPQYLSQVEATLAALNIPIAPYTAAMAIAAVSAAITAQYNALNILPINFTVGGVVYQWGTTPENINDYFGTAILFMTGAMTGSIPFTPVNSLTPVLLTEAEIIGIGGTIARRKQDLYAYSLTLQAAIADMTDPVAITNYNIMTGWPTS
jgi:hypothetical protein